MTELNAQRIAMLIVFVVVASISAAFITRSEPDSTVASELQVRLYSESEVESAPDPLIQPNPSPSPLPASATVPTPAPAPVPQLQAAPAPQLAAEPEAPAVLETSPLVGPEVEMLTAPLIQVSPSRIRQGEAAAVHVSAEWIGSAVLRVGEMSTSMQLLDGVWFALQPFSPDTPTGRHRLVLELYDDQGERQADAHAQVMIVASNVPLEEIFVGGGSGDALDPHDRAAMQHDIDVRFHEHAAVNGPPRWRGAWIRPAAGEDNGPFGGMRSYNGAPPTDWHHGHDIAADYGDPVVAAAPALVAWAGDLLIHGSGVILDHGAGVYSGYWHLSQIDAVVGQVVKAGDRLGLIGVTGLTTGPHLHWELIVRGRDVDPLQWLGEQRPLLPGEGR